MVTLVSVMDLHITDARSRRKLVAQRATFGDLEDYNQSTLSLSVGESRTIEFSRFCFAHFRDIVDLDIVDPNDASKVVSFKDYVGNFSLASAGKLVISVPSITTISLDRAINLLYA